MAERNSAGNFVRVGACWRNRNSAGKDYLSVSMKINGQDVSVYLHENQYKDPGSRQPDFRATMPKDLAESAGIEFEESQTPKSPNASKYRARGRREARYDTPRPPRPAQREGGSGSEDEIPF